MSDPIASGVLSGYYQALEVLAQHCIQIHSYDSSKWEACICEQVQYSAFYLDRNLWHAVVRTRNGTPSTVKAQMEQDVWNECVHIAREHHPATWGLVVGDQNRKVFKSDFDLDDEDVPICFPNYTEVMSALERLKEVYPTSRSGVAGYDMHGNVVEPPYCLKVPEKKQ